MTINTHYTPNFTQLQTLNNINNDATIKDRNQVEQDLHNKAIFKMVSAKIIRKTPLILTGYKL
ncbi:hypothetical protein BTM391_05670 [Helicobacter pylori]